jgi:hypothetical protein
VIDVFVSRPTLTAPEFAVGLQGFLTYLDSHGFRPRTLGATDYPVAGPLDEVISLMKRCRGAIILGYPQIEVRSGAIKGREIDAPMKKKRGRESLLIVLFASGAHHHHRRGAGSVLSRMIRLMAKRTRWCLCG